MDGLHELPTYGFYPLISFFLNPLLILPGSIGPLFQILLSLELLCLSLKILERLLEQSLLLFGLKFVFPFFFESSPLPFDFLLFLLAIGAFVLRDLILFLESMLAKGRDVECVVGLRNTAVHYLLREEAPNDTENLSIMRTYAVIEIFEAFWAPATGTRELYSGTTRTFFFVDILKL